ncbi:prolyl oligopeptidase family serine peptidase [Novosphingobium sp.]|uniref:S9 family peptidase n=1 Tax=Novosphingobium sp. TaxID=1874826 RepID=UPI0038BCAC44
MQGQSGRTRSTVTAMRVGAMLATLAAGTALQAQPAPAPHPLTIDDIMALKTVGGLTCSPDGKQAAYLVGTVDAKADKRHQALWLADLAGDAPRVLVDNPDGVADAQFTPDGKAISFVAKRGKDEQAQIWVLDRRGGEAQKLTDVKGEILGYKWSPDARRLLLTLSDAKPEGPKDDPERPRPLVIDGTQIKEDRQGFVTAEDHGHLYVFDVATKALTQITPSGIADETAAEWSPDGKTIAYLADHRLDPAAPATDWLTLVAPEAKASPRVVAKLAYAFGQKLIWSADGSRIAHLYGDVVKVNEYTQPHLAQTVLATGVTTPVAGALPYSVAFPVSLGAGKVGLVAADDRHEVPLVADLASGAVQRLGDGSLAVADQCDAPDAKAPRAVIASGDGKPSEVYALEGNRFRVLTSHNREVAARVAWAPVEDFAVKASDGSEAHGLLVRPLGAKPGTRYPTVMWIHGGPTAQDAHELEAISDNMFRQLLAANGYAALALNYRGSSGRGDDYARTIAADWGNKEVKDLHAAYDWAVAQGFADPARLGSGGWSYGGILTDFLIVRDNRVKAAISGAGEGNIFALFGVDQYIKQYSQEIGTPWGAFDRYVQMSEPLLHADRIKTPTLFLGGTADDNVPLIGGQQLYQALKLTGVPTRLVAYPDEFHGIRRPSFQRDRYERVLDWYGRYLKP